jgi:hypothetical protein
MSITNNAMKNVTKNITRVTADGVRRRRRRAPRRPDSRGTRRVRTQTGRGITRIRFA